MENHHAINGKTHYKWQFSIAFCMFTRWYLFQMVGFWCPKTHRAPSRCQGKLLIQSSPVYSVTENAVTWSFVQNFVSAGFGLIYCMYIYIYLIIIYIYIYIHNITLHCITLKDYITLHIYIYTHVHEKICYSPKTFRESHRRKITGISSGETLSFVGCSAERLPGSSGSLTAQQFVAWWLLCLAVRVRTF